ncbi:MAG: hypothetical protein JWN88_1248 [Frankiales bacterium]|jgi:hypothetical protein|nr:hypothetical protein [Frankiales bacterium]
MTTRRRLLATASAAFAAAALTACEKPAPLVTVVNAGRSVYSEANTYCFEEQSFEAGNCSQRHTGQTQLAVVSGEPVGIDVGEELVEGRWFIELSDPNAAEGQSQPQQSQPQDGHYFTFTAPSLPEGGSLLLTVRSLEQERPTGEWVFRLVPR